MSIEPGLKIFRYEVPVDDRWHELRIGGDPLHVAARVSSVVEFWAFEPGEYPSTRHFRVVGTGQPIPAGENRWLNSRYHGSAITAGGAMVWHLIEEAP